MSERYQDEAWLRAEYHDRGRTMREIADDCDVQINTINYWMDKFGIDRRSRNAHNRVEYANYQMRAGGYMAWQAHVSGENTPEMVYVHRLLAVAEYGFDTVTAEMDTHHKNRCTFDNRPENIELIDRGEHASLHNEARREGCS